MNSFKESIAFWLSVLGTLLGYLGMIQSLNWLSGVGVLVAAGFIGAIAYARRQRQLIESAVLKVAGRSIDSLNAASLRRRLNRSLIIQEAQNEATVDGEDLTVRWKCSGYCRADRETTIEFSVDADNFIPFDQLRCFGYDLRQDPAQLHSIVPMLIGPDGLSKKIAVPFLAPLSARQPFSVLLTYELPGCMKAGIEYYGATLSFDQESVPRCSVRLAFRDGRPKWLRVYECRPRRGVVLKKDLRPNRDDENVVEYLDTAEGTPGKSLRIYVFSRSPKIAKYRACSRG